MSPWEASYWALFLEHGRAWIMLAREVLQAPR